MTYKLHKGSCIRETDESSFYFGGQYQGGAEVLHWTDIWALQLQTAKNRNRHNSNMLVLCRVQANGQGRNKETGSGTKRNKAALSLNATKHSGSREAGRGYY